MINKEKLSNGGLIFVSHCPSLCITSQGKSIDEAIKNIKEAADMYLFQQPEKFEDLVELL